MTPEHRSPRVLLLAGARETARIAARLADRDAVRANVIWPGRRPAQPALALPEETVRICDVDLLMERLDRDSVQGLLDVSHPYDREVSWAAAEAARNCGVAYARFEREAWSSLPGDRWTEVPDAKAAVTVLPPGARVFATTGRESLPALAQFEGQILMRQTSLHDEEPAAANTEFVFGTPPFPVDEEVALFQRLDIDVLLCRNTGGAAGASKLEAARTLGLPIVLLGRPDAPAAPVFRDIEEAAEWLENL